MVSSAKSGREFIGCSPSTIDGGNKGKATKEEPPVKQLPEPAIENVRSEIRKLRQQVQV